MLNILLPFVLALTLALLGVLCLYLARVDRGLVRLVDALELPPNDGHELHALELPPVAYAPAVPEPAPKRKPGRPRKAKAPEPEAPPVDPRQLTISATPDPANPPA